MSLARAERDQGNGPARFDDYATTWVDADMAAELGVWRWDLAGGLIELSASLAVICGSDQPVTITVERFLDILHPDDRQKVRGEMESAIVEGRPFSWQARFQAENGEQRTVFSTGSSTDAHGQPVAEMVGVCRDLSARMNATSMVDQLERRLSDIIANSPSIISIKDLDLRYRLANQDVADLARRPLEEIIGHTATELFPGATGARIDAQASEAIATRQTIHSDITVVVHRQERTFHLVTFALTGADGEPLEVCTIATDVTDSRLRAEQTRQRRDATDLIGSALSDQRLVAVSQPVYDIAGGHEVSSELLVRIALPARAGLLQPAAFLPMAEQFDLVQGIDTWMVDRALELAASGRVVQVNLSAVTFADPRARETIISALERDSSLGSNIVFEITETAAACHLDAACEFAAALTEHGCGLALDDFGTGFASFTYLRRLPLRYLKIDRSFVTGLPSSEDDRRVVSSIIGIARQFELWTIAEGVEDAATLEILTQLGADYAQGFHLGVPTTLPERRGARH